jgi:hypothetical protein
MICGCEKTEKISEYTVPKHESLQTSEYLADFDRRHPPDERMLAVIVPNGELFWFFKLQGPVKQVADRKTDVLEFLKSARFVHPDKLNWTLPPNWRELPGDERQMRVATIVLDGPAALEIAVSNLSVHPDRPINDQVLANVNRWRQQLALAPIEEYDFSWRTEKIEIDHSAGYLLDITGRPQPKPAGMQMPKRQPKPQETRQQRDQTGGPVYEKPEGWEEGQGNQFSRVALQARDGESQVVITISSAGGSRLANVNRWRAQVHLPPVTEDQLDSLGKKVAVGASAGEQFEMTNDGRTIFAVIFEDRGRTWFIKLDGNPELAERERSKFEAFLKSLRWS